MSVPASSADNVTRKPSGDDALRVGSEAFAIAASKGEAGDGPFASSQPAHQLVPRPSSIFVQALYAYDDMIA